MKIYFLTNVSESREYRIFVVDGTNLGRASFLKGWTNSPLGSSEDSDWSEDSIYHNMENIDLWA